MTSNPASSEVLTIGSLLNTKSTAVRSALPNMNTIDMQPGRQSHSLQDQRQQHDNTAVHVPCFTTVRSRANLEQDEQKRLDTPSVPVQTTASASESVATGTLPVIPPFGEACNLVRASHSCLVVDTHRRQFAMSPVYLKKKTGVQEQLGTELLKYSEIVPGKRVPQQEECTVDGEPDTTEETPCKKKKDKRSYKEDSDVGVC
ncbi:uncharacterized protein LOC121314006 [Polyodon spathula]|uniref:uncharacterized protein LOC121314006 n=1 Tax=Polyodon spathula TaxID=7913 RepID=UPI001B7F452F|nr:uncharacterized protein LOC121314006 [Polyodon spathula]